MSSITGQSKLARALGYGIIAIIVLMPFHAVFTTWLASNFNHFDLLRIWKDLLLVPMGIGALWLAYRDKRIWRAFWRNPLVLLIGAYALLEICLGAWAVMAHRVNASALIYGWINDLQYLAFFVITLVVVAIAPLKQGWARLLLMPAALVVGFGLLQHYVLPSDFLRHVGYGPHTLPLYETVDQKTAYIRLQSTLRGPNPLGAYLILVMTAISALLVKRKKQRLPLAVFLVASAIVLFFTYSRSAWIGLLLAIATLLWLLLPPAARRVFIYAITVCLIVGLGSVVLLRHNDRVENTFFHTDEHSHSSQSSNQKRSSALASGLKDIWHQPLGSGPGTAGPASVRNNHQVRLAENYYLQIGQELGIIGMLIYLAINAYVFVYLWQQRTNMLACVLLASFVGISFVNLLSHGWADDTLSLIWWGLAGIALAPAILNTNKRKHHEKTQKVAKA